MRAQEDARRRAIALGIKIFAVVIHRGEHGSPRLNLVFVGDAKVGACGEELRIVGARQCQRILEGDGLRSSSRRSAGSLRGHINDLRCGAGVENQSHCKYSSQHVSPSS